MKLVTEEDVEKAQESACKQLNMLVNTTDMNDDDDRKRTNNYCEWIATKTDFAIHEKSVNFKDEKYKRIRRGSVVWVEFGFNVGAEFGGRHPAVVLRKTECSIFVVPVSSKEPTNAKPWHVKIEKIYGFKDIVRWTNVLTLMNVSLQRVDVNASIGNVKGKVLDDINAAIKATHIY